MRGVEAVHGIQPADGLSAGVQEGCIIMHNVRGEYSDFEFLDGFLWFSMTLTTSFLSTFRSLFSIKH
jgi:hypothetical protein